MTGAEREIEAYLGALAAVVDALGRGPLAAGNVGDLVRLYRARSIPKSGAVDERITYEMHGTGCLFVIDDQREVDVDISAAGRDAFDAWRVRRLASTSGTAAASALAELVEECDRMVGLGVLESLAPGWYSVSA
ncbi:DUF6896 domain-containing protein [Actinokineospora soli]|uniref:DUF6896 domain-containing protein n=1 Tax=Actinokineospora soli TaxID=1048753 RepID=A0ABW2TSY6_9PSEU